jgi:hypothetical protein
MNQRIWLTMGFVSHVGKRLSRSSGPKFGTWLLKEGDEC